MIHKFLLSLTFLTLTFSGVNAWQFADKSGHSITLEIAEEADLKDCESIFVNAFNEAYREFSPQELGVVDKTTFLKEAFQDVYEDFSNNNQTLVTAKQNGKVIGFVGFKPTEKQHQIYISQLAVKPEWWKNGIGRHLVLSVFQVFEDTNHLVVIPRKINTVARDFYSNLGFKVCDYMHPGYNPERYIGYEWIE